MASAATLKHQPVRELVISDSGQLRPVTMYGGKGLGDVRTVSGEFLLDLQHHWRRVGQQVLDVVAERHPELYFAAMVKLARVLKVEVGGPGEFAKLGSKEEIVKKLEERSGPEARKLFEKFVRDLEKLQAQQEQES
jgi:hypothetical protein